MYNITKTMHSAKNITASPLSGSPRFTENHSTPRRSKRRPRKDSNRGKLTTPFSQFIDATRFIRSAIKYIFITWALVAGIVALFNFASKAAWQTKVIETTDTNTETPVSNSTTLIATPSEELPVESANPIVVEDRTIVAQEQSPQATDIAPSEKPTTEAALTSNPTVTGATFKVTAYSAMLFESINDTQTKQTPLDKNSTLLLLERKDDWIRVMTPDKQTTGYVHSSQVAAN